MRTPSFDVEILVEKVCIIVGIYSTKISPYNGLGKAWSYPNP